MAKCIECGTSLGGDVLVCPICGANQSSNGDVRLDNIERKLSSTPTFLIKNNSEQEAEQKRLEVERLMKRGDECFNSAKAWLGSKIDMQEVNEKLKKIKDNMEMIF